MPVYERYSGAHVAERVSPAADSPGAKELARLAADGTDGWRLAEDDAKPVRKATRKAKDAE